MQEVHYGGKLNRLHNFPFLKKRLGREYNGDLKVARDAKSKWMCALPQNTGTWAYSGGPSNQRTNATNVFATRRCVDKSFKGGLQKIRRQRFGINHQTLISVCKFLYKTPTFPGSWEYMTLAMMCSFPKIPVSSLGMRCHNQLNLALCSHYIINKTFIT